MNSKLSEHDFSLIIDDETAIELENRLNYIGMKREFANYVVLNIGTEDKA